MLKLHHGQVTDSIKTLFQLNSDVHYAIPDININFLLLEGIMNLSTIHFPFIKLYIFGLKFLDVLVLMYHFLNLRKFPRLIFFLII